MEVREPAFPHTREGARGRATVGERAWVPGTGLAGQLPPPLPEQSWKDKHPPPPPPNTARMSFRGRGPEKGDEPGTVLRPDEDTQLALQRQQDVGRRRRKGILGW